MLYVWAVTRRVIGNVDVLASVVNFGVLRRSCVPDVVSYLAIVYSHSLCNHYLSSS